MNNKCQNQSVKSTNRSSTRCSFSVDNITTESNPLSFLSSGGGSAPALRGWTGRKIQRFCCCTWCCGTGNSEFQVWFQLNQTTLGLTKNSFPALSGYYWKYPTGQTGRHTILCILPQNGRCVSVSDWTQATGETTSVLRLISAAEFENRKLSLSLAPRYMTDWNATGRWFIFEGRIA